MADSLGSVFGSAVNAGSNLLGGVGNAIGSGLSGIGNLIGSGVSGLGNLLGGGSGGGGGASPLGAAGLAAPAAAAAAPAAAAADFSTLPASMLGFSGDLSSDLGNTGSVDPTLLQAVNGTGVTPLNPSDIASSNQTLASLTSSFQPNGGGLSSLLGGGGAGGGAGGIFNSKMLLPGLLLGGALLHGMNGPSTSNLSSIAGQEEGLAAGLQPTAVAELETGALPGPWQQSVNSALADAQANIKSRYAQMGLSGSTMEGQDLDRASQNAQAQAAQIAQQLSTEGFQAASGASSEAAQLYEAILAQQVSQNNDLTNALSGFAGALALGSAGGRT